VKLEKYNPPTHRGPEKRQIKIKPTVPACEVNEANQLRKYIRNAPFPGLFLCQ
jgi:hypothetical protein